jgi:hypothetical protein
VTKRTTGRDALREALKAREFLEAARPIPFPEVGKVYHSQESLKEDVAFSRGKANVEAGVKLKVGENEITVKITAAKCAGVKICPGCSTVFPLSKKACSTCPKKTKKVTMLTSGDDCPGILLIQFPEL